MAQWVSFRDIKSRVRIEQILAHYGLLEQAYQKGSELRLRCVFHEEQKASLSISTQKNAFHCFGCGAKGNVIAFVRMKEEIDGGDLNQDDRQAALLIAEWFGITSSRPAQHPAQQGTPEKILEVHEIEVIEESSPEAADAPQGRKEPAKEEVGVINPPLQFELKNLDHRHPYLIEERGLSEETIDRFGVGFHGGRGIMHGRVVIPIHNEAGELIAYAGRWPGEPPEDEPKYKLPPAFKKHLVVYNLHRAKEIAEVQGLIVAEGFFSVMDLWQQGQENAVAIMGSSMSKEQEQLIVNTVGPEGRVTLAFDDDEAGRKCTEAALKRLSRQLYVKVEEL